MRYYKSYWNPLRPIFKLQDNVHVAPSLFKELSPAEFLVMCRKEGKNPEDIEDETYKFVTEFAGPR